MSNFTKIYLESRATHIDGPMWEWYAQRVEPNGSTVNGFVQADHDGECIAADTFEKDKE